MFPCCRIATRAFQHPVFGLRDATGTNSLRFSMQPAKLLYIARVAELVDARDLKSCVPKGTCGFESHPGHFRCRD